MTEDRLALWIFATLMHLRWAVLAGLALQSWSAFFGACVIMLASWGCLRLYDWARGMWP
jgi:hypothetical protein